MGHFDSWRDRNSLNNPGLFVFLFMCAVNIIKCKCQIRRTLFGLSISAPFVFCRSSKTPKITWSRKVGIENRRVKFFSSKFYGKVGAISWLLFHLIWKNYVLYCDFDLKSWIVDFFTRFTHEKTPQTTFLVKISV